MGFHFYADDSQLYLSFDSCSVVGQASAVAQIEACVREIDCWMRANKLNLNSWHVKAWFTWLSRCSTLLKFGMFLY